MKSTFFILAGAGIAAAQSMADLPPCGQTCVGNMVGVASANFGCAPGDLRCYCTNVNFGYGIRDCSNQACPPGDAAKVIEFGTKYCASVLAGSAVSNIASSTASGAGPSSTGTGSPSAITTIPLVAVSTGSGTTFITTTGFSTIYGPLNGAASSAIGSASSAIGSASSVVGSVTSNIAASASSKLASASSGLASVSSEAASAINSASGVLSSASGALNSASSSLGAILSSATNAAASSTSTGGAPIQTAAPLFIGAGLLAMLAL